MRRTIIERVLPYLVVVAALVATTRVAAAQGKAGAGKYTLGIFVPTAPFTSSDQVRGHAEALAKAIEGRAKIDVSVQVFFRYADLVRARPHLAVLEGRCAATTRGATVIASGLIGGRSTERWGLYSSKATSVPKLKGSKIIHVAAGCADEPFMAHTLLASELPLSFFGPRISRRTARLAATATANNVAAAAFLPASVAGGLQRIYDAGYVPGPALVALRPLPRSLRSAIASAATTVKGGPGISGYRAGGAARYRGLANALKRRAKRPIFAPPEDYRLRAAARIAIPTKKPPRQSVVRLVR
jgi:hypothetical protein